MNRTRSRKAQHTASNRAHYFTIAAALAIIIGGLVMAGRTEASPITGDSLSATQVEQSSHDGALAIYGRQYDGVSRDLIGTTFATPTPAQMQEHIFDYAFAIN